MAAKKPIVVATNGSLQQIQSGDTLNATVTGMAEAVTVLTNANAGAITIGQVVYSSATGACDLAKADAAATAYAIGLVSDTTVATTDPANIITSGILSGLTLTSGAEYYLSAGTAGLLTATAPTTAGHLVVHIGTAISTSKLKINIGQPILL